MMLKLLKNDFISTGRIMGVIYLIVAGISAGTLISHYTKADAEKIKEGIEVGCGVDAPGSFIAWLASVSPVYAMEMPGRRYDIGNLESYEKVQKEYRGICK